MKEPTEIILLDADEEAARLWSGSRQALAGAGDDLVALCESLDLGVRAAEILVIHKLQRVKAKFPATIVLQLELPVAEVEPFRDAVTTPKAMQFTDILDLLSAEGLECVSPRLHRGWEDRRFSCARSRATAQEGVGVALPEDDRAKLLLLSAYRNRIFRYPPPLRIVPEEILDALPALQRMVGQLQNG